MEEVEFLGYVISSKEITTNPKKIEAVVKFPISQNFKELRSFLDMRDATDDSSKTIQNLLNRL